MEPSDDNILYTPKIESKKRVRELITYYEERILPKRASCNDISFDQEIEIVHIRPVRASVDSYHAPVEINDDYMEAPMAKSIKADENATPLSSKKPKQKKPKSSTVANTRRMFVIHEIISTEKAYVDNLSNVHKVCSIL